MDGVPQAIEWALSHLGDEAKEVHAGQSAAVGQYGMCRTIIFVVVLRLSKEIISCVRKASHQHHTALFLCLLLSKNRLSFPRVIMHSDSIPTSGRSSPLLCVQSAEQRSNSRGAGAGRYPSGQRDAIPDDDDDRGLVVELPDGKLFKLKHPNGRVVEMPNGNIVEMLDGQIVEVRSRVERVCVCVCVCIACKRGHTDRESDGEREKVSL